MAKSKTSRAQRKKRNLLLALDKNEIKSTEGNIPSPNNNVFKKVEDIGNGFHRMPLFKGSEVFIDVETFSA
jgi:hypothetical protein